MADANIIVKLIDQTGPGLNQVQGNLDKIEKSTGRVSKGFKAMATAAAGFIASIGAAAVLRYVDSIQTLDNRLRLVTSSQSELNARFNDLAGIANRTRAPLQETVTLFSRIALNAESIGLNAQEALQVTENFSTALAISGATTAEAESAMLQFSQALAGGTLRGEEFNAINEAAPRVMQVLADTLGITKGQLREYASDGLLNAELVSRALISATDELQEQFAQTSVTVGQALTILSNNFTTLSRDFLNTTSAGSVLSDVILAIAENLDVLVPIVAVGAVGAFVALVAAISPVAAIIGGVTLALGAVVVAVNKGIDAFGGWEGVLNGAKKAFINFKIGTMKIVEDFVNGTISALATFKNNIVATFSGIGAAVTDPLNAFDAFDEAFDESISQNLAEGSEKFVDFSDSIEAAQSDLLKLEKQVEDNGDTTKDYTEEVDENTDAVVDNTRNTERLDKLMAQFEKQTQRNTSAYADFTAELQRSAELARLDSEERRIQETIYKALEARAKDLDVAVGELSAEERAQTEKRVRELLELESANKTYQDNVKDFTTQTNQLIEDNYRNTATAIQQIEDAKQEYIANARELGRLDDEETQKAILEFNRQIQEEKTKIAEEALKEQEERSRKYIQIAEHQLMTESNAYEKYAIRMKQYKEDLDAGMILSEEEKNRVLRSMNDQFVKDSIQEYGNLYSAFEEKITGMTGLTRKEFGIMDDTVKLIFGESITDIIKGTFATGVRSILGFRTQGTNDIDGMKSPIASTMGTIDGTIASTFVDRGIGFIGSFVGGGLDLLSGLAGGIFDLFGGVGDFLGNTFGGAFKSISSSIGSLFGSSGGGGSLGGIGSAIGSFFGPVGSIVGSIADFFFADGGYIKPGQFGIVGEAGPELVSGPANVIGTNDTADMLSSNRGVNVNFTINAVDAKGVDELLINKRDLITNIVRSSIEETGGIY
jgi:tape measure domain-containing protein